MAVFLQLTSKSMRLTEMNYMLYSSIYRCLYQEEDAGMTGQDNALASDSVTLNQVRYDGLSMGNHQCQSACEYGNHITDKWIS
jgi:hypothetical protein